MPREAMQGWGEAQPKGSKPSSVSIHAANAEMPRKLCSKRGRIDRYAVAIRYLNGRLERISCFAETKRSRKKSRFGAVAASSPTSPNLAAILIPCKITVRGLAVVFTAMFMLGNDVLQVNNLVPPSRLRRVRDCHSGWSGTSPRVAEQITTVLRLDSLCVLNRTS